MGKHAVLCSELSNNSLLYVFPLLPECLIISEAYAYAE